MKRLLFGLLISLTGIGTALANPAPYQVKRPMQIQQQLKAAYQAKGSHYQPRTEHLKPDGSPVYINRLILKDSPYLLQHAHNPVDWYPWGEEAFARAKQEHKPIFLSIGYSTCHWCHVMERESFENIEIARYLNDHFIAIKVDRESQPDVDEVYMTAVMLLNGQGGWPMSSFLTPDGKPFYGGTYYPPRQFLSLLRQIDDIWTKRRDDAIKQAQRVADAVAAHASQRAKAATLDKDIVANLSSYIVGSLDDLQGGFGVAPKFPHEPWLFLLLDQAERRHDEEALHALQVTLDAMARGGIYDQVGGGFHRYSTDNAWLVPHFEKMLYNQAQLARVYLLAWRLTGKPLYRRVASQTLDYVLREMTSPEGGFYSATDADSEGREGAFFTWTPEQLRQALPEEDAKLAIDLYGVSKRGNFEGGNILHLPVGLETYAKQHDLALDALYRRVDGIDQRLRQARERRVHPLRDDKIVTAWNGMMISALAQAAELLGEERYRQAAERAARFLWQHSRRGPGRLWRVQLAGRASADATLEDYAYLGAGLLHLFDLSHEPRWLARARELADALLERFSDPASGGFYMNEAGSGITAMPRPKDSGADGATASGSSVALHLLEGLWRRSGEVDYRNQAEALVAGFSGNLAQQPSSYAYMLTALDDLRNGELSGQGYAAQGGIRLRGRIEPLEKGKGLLHVSVDIPAGWHVNAHQTDDKELIPTQLGLAKGAAGWRLGPVTYPTAQRVRLGFQEAPLPVYQGKLDLQALVEQDTAPVAGGTLPLSLSLQACNDRVCLPPEQIGLWVSPYARIR